MSLVRARAVRDAEDRPLGMHLTMDCPGCDDLHAVWVYDPESNTHPQIEWTWNGDEDRPTISPSILVTGGSRDLRCHSFVRDGQWQFLGDSTHDLSGQTVPMRPITRST